jgi:hypothetical protein
MCKISMLLLAGLLACTALAAAAVPPTPAPTAQQAAIAQAPALPWLTATTTATPAAQAPDDIRQILEPQQSCPLCVIGYHCCVHGPNAQCVPNSNPC